MLVGNEAPRAGCAASPALSAVETNTLSVASSKPCGLKIHCGSHAGSTPPASAHRRGGFFEEEEVKSFAKPPLARTRHSVSVRMGAGSPEESRAGAGGTPVGKSDALKSPQEIGCVSEWSVSPKEMVKETTYKSTSISPCRGGPASLTPTSKETLTVTEKSHKSSV